MTLQEELAQPLVDHQGLDLDGAQQVTYRLSQSFRYTYDRPATDLRQRLVVVPRPNHGNLHRRMHRVTASDPAARLSRHRDEHGNVVVGIRLAVVATSVEFQVNAVLERVGPHVDAAATAAALDHPRYLRPTRLTSADDRIRAFAVDLRAGTSDDREFAVRCAEAVRAAVQYSYGVTGVRTTAAEALAGGLGVCQDHAHVMLAVCRAVGVPARYVSGHLLGIGGTHAWVEVLVPEGSTATAGAVAFGVDPCNGVRTGPRHLAVATGRDYRDVAPTSGYYSGDAVGTLSASRTVGVTSAA